MSLLIYLGTEIGHRGMKVDEHCSPDWRIRPWFYYNVRSVGIMIITGYNVAFAPVAVTLKRCLPGLLSCSKFLAYRNSSKFEFYAAFSLLTIPLPEVCSLTVVLCSHRKMFYDIIVGIRSLDMDTVQPTEGSPLFTWYQMISTGGI